MAFRAPDVFTSQTIGTTAFLTSNPFDVLQESVYLNGAKLVRGIGYTATRELAGTPLDQLDTVTLATPIASITDVLEIYIFDEAKVDTLLSKMDDVLVATIGSWQWDKSSNLLTMFDTSGNPKFKFSVSDSAEEATRERRQDLET